jgi:hypothetical protein
MKLKNISILTLLEAPNSSLGLLRGSEFGFWEYAGVLWKIEGGLWFCRYAELPWTMDGTLPSIELLSPWLPQDCSCVPVSLLVAALWSFFENWVAVARAPAIAAVTLADFCNVDLEATNVRDPGFKEKGSLGSGRGNLTASGPWTGERPPHSPIIDLWDGK